VTTPLNATVVLGASRRRHPLFRTAQLNVVGWAALVSATAAAALVLALLVIVLGRPWWTGALVGSGLVLGGLLALDLRRARGSLTSFGWTDDVADVHAVADRLRERGIEVSVEPEPPSLVFHQRDARAVADELTAGSGRAGRARP
jgi:hypothetical protein